jgi:rRNA-processing protein FCF1
MWHSMEEQDSTSPTHCFLDTNTFLHFQRFDTVDWPKVLGAQQICLMLTPTVMEELDHHKDDPKNSGRQKRAKEILSKFDDILPTDTAGIRVPVGQNPNVELQELLDEPNIDLKAFGLSSQKGDHCLLASILDFRNAHPGATICLITRDFPLRRKALQLKIPVVNPEGKIDPLADFSTEAVERRRLERELQELKNRLPKLTFGFFEDATRKIVPYTTAPLSKVQNIEVLTQAFDSQFVPVQVIERKQRLERILKEAIHQTSEESIREFREKYERYLELFEAACRRDYLQKYGHRCRLDLILHNEGNATATSVEIVLQFPAGSVVIRAQDEEEALEFPKEPQPSWLEERAHSPWSGIYGLSGPAFALPVKRDYAAEATYALMRSQQKWKGPFCNDTSDTHIVTYRAEELLHEKTWELPPLIACIWPGGSSIDYMIRARELPRKIEEKLHIRWTSA